MKEFIESIIKTGNYVLAEMEERIQKMYVLGKISEADMVELLNLAAENADDNKQIDVAAVLADLESRIARLEAAGVVVWTSGHVPRKAKRCFTMSSRKVNSATAGMMAVVLPLLFPPARLTDGLSLLPLVVLSLTGSKRMLTARSSLCRSLRSPNRNPDVT